jgi:hypothetical protein
MMTQQIHQGMELIEHFLHGHDALARQAEAIGIPMGPTPEVGFPTGDAQRLKCFSTAFTG